MADVLQGLIESGLVSVTTEKERQPAEIVSDPAAPYAPWFDASRIAAANARDVLERLERGMDDRTFEQRSADATEARARTRAAQPVKWRFNFSSKAAAKPRPKVERTDEVRAYFREYQRRLRARQKADASTNC